MLIDLGDKITYEVKYAGKIYELREPTAKDVQKLQSKVDEGDDFSRFMDFLVSLGLPAEICESLGLSKIKKLTDKLTEEFAEKK